MKKVSVRSNIINQSFNTIIFDLNGTITSSISKDPRHVLYRNNYIEQITGKPVIKNLPQDTTPALKLCGLDPNQYYKFRNKNIDWNSFNSYSETTITTLNELTYQGYNLVLYTDCFLSQIEPTLSILKATSYFQLIISKEMNFNKPSYKAYQFIAKEFGVNINQLLMIANDWEKDLRPLQEIGGNTIFIESEKYLNDAKKIIINIHSKTNECNNSIAANNYYSTH
jgi:FMN phosphatase YigB (HAD superfamily)